METLTDMRIFILILISTPLISFSQPDSTLLNRINSQTVIVKSIAIHNNNQIFIGTGTGFVINGKFLGTCYHVYKYFKKDILKEIYIKYNIHYKNKKMMYDSAFVNLKPVTSAEDHNDSKSDFVLLRLKHPIIINDLLLDSARIDKNQNYYATGITGKNLNDVRVNSKLKFIYISKEGDLNYYAFMGNWSHGFSGSPIYNSKGGIVAILQRGVDELPADFKKNKLGLSQRTIDTILLRSENGQKIGFAIPIVYIYNTYLKNLNN